MNYEQKYNEALERANVAHKDEDKHLKATLERIFPELKESEDERIRKNLIELFHDTVSNDEIFSDYGLDKTEVLDWLETQGEQKTTWKPTEKQINAIRLARSFVTDDFGDNPTLSEVLKELEEQLKKL